MRKILLGILLAISCSQANAQQSDMEALVNRYSTEAGPSTPATEIPDEFLRGVAPASIAQQVGAEVEIRKSSPSERQQLFNGAGYTIIAPIFNGVAGNYSFIRFWNISLKSAPITITVVGWPTGRVYGSATVTIPSAGAPQYPIGDILSAASASTLVGGDEGWTLYIPPNTASVGFQHVIYNSNNLFFENVSLCRSNALSNLNQYLMNVHTSTFKNTYPSIVYLHNYLAVSQNVRIYLIDGNTGALRGSHTYTLGANRTYTLPIENLEADVGYTPGSSNFHYNILFANPITNGSISVMIGQVIFNSTFNSFVNMSQYCDIG